MKGVKNFASGFEVCKEFLLPVPAGVEDFLSFVQSAVVAVV